MFNINNKSVNNKNEIAEGFNNFFANIGYNVNHNAPRADRDFTTYMPYHNAQSMFLTPLVPEDILLITNKFKQKTSYGADDVSTKLLTKTIDKIINPITHIINLTFETGIFPNYFKCAKVIPIFKAGDPSTLNN